MMVMRVPRQIPVLAVPGSEPESSGREPTLFDIALDPDPTPVTDDDDDTGPDGGRPRLF